MARTYGHGTHGQPTTLWCCERCKHFFKNEAARNKEKNHKDVHAEDITDAYSKNK